MKTIAAILLSCLLVFNLCGYRLVSSWMQSRADLKLEAALDSKSYDASELITIKVPITNPYLHQQTSFERVNGEISINGIQYKYVERRVANDSIAYTCIPNHAKMQAKKALHNYFSAVNDLAKSKDPKSKNSLSHLKYLFSEFELKQFEWNLTPPCPAKISFSGAQLFHLPQQYNGSPSQPPENISFS